MELSSIHAALAEQLLLEIKEQREKALITYGDLCKRASNVVTPRNSAKYIGDLSEICYEHNMPLISIMVVNGDTYMPGEGFYKLYEELTGKIVEDKEQLVKEELGKVRTYSKWETLAEILGISINNLNIEESKVDKIGYKEGRLILKEHMQRERNPEVIKKAKAKFLTEKGSLYCEICKFDFEKTYGLLGKGMIEGHHIRPVCQMEEGDVTLIEDIKMVCANCHRVIHKNMHMDWEELKKVIENRM